MAAVAMVNSPHAAISGTATVSHASKQSACQQAIPPTTPARPLSLVKAVPVKAVPNHCWFHGDCALQRLGKVSARRSKGFIEFVRSFSTPHRTFF